jgi:hypothetical protein
VGDIKLPVHSLKFLFEKQKIFYDGLMAKLETVLVPGFSSTSIL